MSEPPDQPFLSDLRETLAARFDLQELRTLCFDLDVRYDDLSGEGNAAKARELVDHLKRRGSIPQLIEVGRRQRPEIPWPELTPEQDSDEAAWAAAREQYDAQIIKQYGEIRIFGQTTPKPLREIFTDVFVLGRLTAQRCFTPKAVRDHLWHKDRGEPWRVSERLPAEELLSRGDKFFILGRPGAGKTTFLKRLAVREAQRGAGGPCLGKIPIFVSLKQFAEAKKSLCDFIVDQFAVCHIPDAAPFVEPLLKSGKALVLFDGLDEVTQSAEAKDDRRRQVTQDIELFARQYDGCHMVVTCRIAATEYTFPAPFIYLEMADFAPEQVAAFVRNWFWDPAAKDALAALAERMLAELARPEHAGIRDQARSPLLLTLLCLSYAETLRFPTQRSKIYEEALKALLKKWDDSKGIQRCSLYGGLSVGRKQQMFARLAYDGFVQDEILFTQANLEDQLKAYLAQVPGMPDPIDIDVEQVLHEIIEQHGLFAEQSRGLFSFAHLTFQEYYAAKYIADSAAPDVLDAMLARMSDDKWREVFLLTAEMLGDATQFLAAFEGALHRLVAARPQVAAWLCWIDELAGLSQAGYNRPATRLFYAHALTLAPFLGLSLDCILARVFALARDYTLARVLARARDYDLYDSFNLVFDFAEVKENMLGLCQQQGRSALYAALSALAMPAAAAPPEAWERYVSELTQLIETQGDLARYRQLEAETNALACAQGERWPLSPEDMETLFTYVDANSLFYDCLQVAYVPDRRAFEDRIFWVPE